jgi:plasmid replication initiation protein
MPKIDKCVTKSNRLVEASYRLSLIEQRLILYAIVEARETQKGLESDSITIEVSRFAEVFSMTGGEIYGQVADAVKTLFNRFVVLNDIHLPSGKPRITTVRWVSSCSYIPGTGAVQLRFAPEMVHYISRLEGEFTSYRLSKIGNLSSVHAVRLYELLVQFLALKRREFDIEWLKETLQVSEEYPRLFDLKRRVLDLAVDQINTHTDITTSYTQRKTGRNVTHLNFKIDAKEAAPKAVKKPSLTRAYVEKHALPGESWEVARARLRAERAHA